ncbi:pyridoxal phosphate-dependent aminotransferase [Acidisphaera sp. L21]|jgi:aspartate aminotransferase|uniref:pyridoxal phosphate-dependent aminotransferase n=1 Tax=Acidisphaera sp. L21 TaxID=1641851 RepID=UPI00131D8BFC|nr:pyridoxal phosphate-dependent aminotransferase [Acidisphaera sp. L21]
MIRNAPPGGPETRIRPQIQDMVTDNIAVLAEKARHISGVIPLWFGEGDLVTPAFIRDAAKRALDAGRTFYVPNMRGTPSLTSALSTYQTRLHGRPIEVDRSTVTPSGMQAVALALELVVEPGTNAVYVTPQWPNIHNAIHVAGGEPRPCPLVLQNNQWTLDIDHVAALCDARTRAIVFSSPANPTGWTATQEDLRALLALSRERGIWIIADEVYGRLYFDGDIAPSMLQLAEPDDLVMTVNSFSKAWAMTGFRLGWLTHPASLAERVGAMTQYLNSGTADFIQEAGATAITEGEGFVGEIRERCRVGVALAHERLAQVSRVRLTAPPHGGMYSFFRIDGMPDARVACLQVLERARVGLAPGELFGDAAAGWLRMCVCRDARQLGIALDRMAEALV